MASPTLSGDYSSNKNNSVEKLFIRSNSSSKKSSSVTKSPNEDCNLIKLKLRKPKNWNWELTTSKSSPNIFLPKIQLFNNKGKLLAETTDSAFHGNSNDDICSFGNYEEKVSNLPKRILQSNSKKSLLTESNPNRIESDYNVNGKNMTDVETFKTEDLNHEDIKIDHGRSKSWQDQTTTAALTNSLHGKNKIDGSLSRMRRSMSTNLVNINEANQFLTQLTNQLRNRGIDYRIKGYNSHENLSVQNQIINDIQTNEQTDNKSFECSLSNVVEEPSPSSIQREYTYNSCNDLMKINERTYTSNLDEKSQNVEEFKFLTTATVKNVNLPSHNFTLSKSKSAIEIPNKNVIRDGVEAQRKKRNHRRMYSSNSARFSSSILERVREFQRQSSSSDSADNGSTNILDSSRIKNENIAGDEENPKYTLRTSKAGTLVVCEESFRNRRVRRRNRSRSRSRTNDSTDNTNNTISCQEKIRKEFQYIGRSHDSRRSSLDSQIDEAIFQRSNDTRYDSAIAGIDKLISRLSSKGEKPSSSSCSCIYSIKQNLKLTEMSNGNYQNKINNDFDFGLKNCNDLKKTSSFTKYNIVNKNNGINIGEQIEIQKNKNLIAHVRKVAQEDVKVMNSTALREMHGESSVGHIALQTLFPTSEDEVISNHLVKDSFRLKSNEKKRRKRSVRSRTGRFQRSDSIDSDKNISADDNDIANSNFDMRTCDNCDEKIKFCSDSGRGQARAQNKSEELNVENDDKIATINIVHLSAIDPSTRILNNKSDEVLLQLVNHLASFQNQKTTVSKQNENVHQKSMENINIKKNNSIHVILKDLTNPLDTNNSKIENSLSITNISSGCKNNSTITKKTSQIIDKTTKENIKSDNIPANENNMGSNVSRHNGKGLSGRRTQSSGSLFNGKSPQSTTKTSRKSLKPKKFPPENLNIEYAKWSNNQHYCQPSNNLNFDESFDETCSMISAVTSHCVSKKDRNKFCGSLPNHLDSDEVVDENFQHKKTELEYLALVPKKPSYCQQQLKKLENQHRSLLQQHQQSNPLQISPYKNTSSGKKSTTHSILGSSAFKTNNDNRTELQLKLPFRTNIDAGCDQGYGSERSPEDELPPKMSVMIDETCEDFLVTHHQFINENVENFSGGIYNYNFITKDCMYTVDVAKGPRGLGFSVSGGSDTDTVFPELIRIKRLFPHQPAWSTGMLQPGDIILEVNGIPLSGLTNCEALEVLRSTNTKLNINPTVKLMVCRPRDASYRKLSPPTEPPKPPQRNLQSQNNSCKLPEEPLPPIQTNYNGEFEIFMTKQQGSLGFTLRKEDESVLGHYVRALVREPALSDGRIKPGDRIVAVNDVILSPMTHEEAVIFLRQSTDTVKLRFYRDEAQTPITTSSPTHGEGKTFANTLKARGGQLRPEAMHLLSDLALRKHVTTSITDDSSSSIHSSSLSPRRLKRGGRNAPSSTKTSQNEVEITECHSNTSIANYIVSNQTSTCSDSESSTFSQSSFITRSTFNNPNETYIVEDVESYPHFIQNHLHRNQERAEDNLEFYEEDELFRIVDEDNELPDRPNYLDLVGQSGTKPIISQKSCFQFSLPVNSYELNNLDNDTLDAPIYIGKINTNNNNNVEHLENYNSLPCETFLVACLTESDLNKSENFDHKNPMYQSAVANVGKGNLYTHQNQQKQQQPPSVEEKNKNGKKILLKWKGAMFPLDDCNCVNMKTVISADSDNHSCATTATNSKPISNQDNNFPGYVPDIEGYKTIVVELNRGWSSRLGFSLQSDTTSKRSVVSAIYTASVAAKDGRLKIGDQLVMVNNETVDRIPTNELIELVRGTRGSICLTVLRKES